MNIPKISFIVPSYNFATHISECVNSILRQDMTSLEVIVVNDGSTDNTKEVLDGLALQDSRIVPIHKKNEGVSVARNTGLAVAKGEYVTFVDADDYLAADYANYMLELARIAESDFCLSLDAFTKVGENQMGGVSVDVLTPEQATALLLSPRIIVGCWNKIYRREWLLNQQLFFSSELFYGEGLQFITSAAQKANSVTVGNKKVYYYRRNNYDSATTRFSIDKMYNGLKSLDVIKDNITKPSEDIELMWKLHRSLFCMGAVVRLETSNKKKEYQDDYNNWLKYIRREIPSLLVKKKVPIYRKLLLFGTCISPKLMSKLDTRRRKGIASRSV
ncbi:MAG: glycosyltransferase [Butyrivibrio sp.]|nr:glycosyltransferase [Butyrivibrio sp.]